MRSILLSAVVIAANLLPSASPALADTVQPRNSLQYLCKATDTGAGEFEFSGSAPLYKCKSSKGVIYYENDKKCSAGGQAFTIGSNAGTKLVGVGAFRQVGTNEIGVCYSFAQGYAGTDTLGGGIFSTPGLAYPDRTDLVGKCDSVILKNSNAYALNLIKSSQFGSRQLVAATCSMKVRLR